MVVAGNGRDMVAVERHGAALKRGRGGAMAVRLRYRVRHTAVNAWLFQQSRCPVSAVTFAAEPSHVDDRRQGFLNTGFDRSAGILANEH